MDAVLKFIDKMVAGMSSSTLQIVRLGGLLVWLIIATIIVTIAWSHGSESVPPSGQDLSMQTIREKIQKEKNLKNPPRMDIGGGRSVTVPGIGELSKNDPTGRSFYPARRKGNELSGDGNRKQYPGYVNQRPGQPARAYEPTLPRDDNARGNTGGNVDRRTGGAPSAGTGQSPFPGRRPAPVTKSPPRTELDPRGNPAPRKQPSRAPATTQPQPRTESPRRVAKPRKGPAPLYRSDKGKRKADPVFKQ